MDDTRPPALCTERTHTAQSALTTRDNCAVVFCRRESPAMNAHISVQFGDVAVCVSERKNARIKEPPNVREKILNKRSNIMDTQRADSGYRSYSTLKKKKTHHSLANAPPIFPPPNTTYEYTPSLAPYPQPFPRGVEGPVYQLRLGMIRFLWSPSWPRLQ